MGQTCEKCGSDELEIISEMPAPHIGPGYVLATKRCCKCGTIQREKGVGRKDVRAT